MRPIHDTYVIKIEKRYEDQSKKGIISINTSIFRDTQEAPEHRDDAHYRHKRLYGTIVSVPLNFTEEVAEIVDPGLPVPGIYFGHDSIAAMKNNGLRTVPKYCCSSLNSFDVITRIDQAHLFDVRIGDKAYFSYLVTEPNNQLDNKGLLYAALPMDIFCVVRNERNKVDGRYRNNIYMQGGWVLVEPDMESWSDITTPSGIIKKPSPGAKYLEATVRHIRKRDDIKSGDKILYEPVADVDITVEDKQYYCMKEEEIMCVC